MLTDIEGLGRATLQFALLPDTTVFLLGLAVGTLLLTLGIGLGYWFGKKAADSDSIDREQFLEFAKNLTSLTSEFSGDVSKYQSRLSDLSSRVDGNSAGGAEVSQLLSQIMQANQELQARLDNAEERLENQTDQIASYLTEARTDGLTGLLNRRAFDRALDELFTGWKKKDQAFALGLIDIDHFKHINDTYGHQGGDAVLQSLASTLQEELESDFVVARFGGEEFAILTAGVELEVAAALERVRKRIEGEKIDHEGTMISVTMSAGASGVQLDDRIGNVVRRSDEALYAAKLGGRNRVYIHDGSLCRLFSDVPEVSDTPASQAPAESSEPKVSVENLTSDEMEKAADKQQVVNERLQRLVEDESKRILQK